jgi:hypothetical protein
LGVNAIPFFAALHELAFWALVFVGSCVILGNYAGAIRARRTTKSFSQVPFVGVLFCALALWISPWPELRDYWWLPLLADVTIPMTGLLLLALAWMWAAGRFKRQ